MKVYLNIHKIDRMIRSLENNWNYVSNEQQLSQESGRISKRWDCGKEVKVTKQMDGIGCTSKEPLMMQINNIS